MAILLSAVIGIPLYIRAEAVIPLASVLLAKGMGIGAVLALKMQNHANAWKIAIVPEEQPEMFSCYTINLLVGAKNTS